VATWLFWTYFINAVLVINHEIDSAHWKEWDLFHLPGGISGFLVMHFFVLALILLGLVEVFRRTSLGLALSVLLGVGGLAAFGLHMHFIGRGRPEFKTPVSLFILISILLCSLVQLALTVCLMVR
jgi:hypothetical protein